MFFIQEAICGLTSKLKKCGYNLNKILLSIKRRIKPVSWTSPQQRSVIIFFQYARLRCQVKKPVFPDVSEKSGNIAQAEIFRRSSDLQFEKID